MSVIRKTTKLDGVLTDMTSVILSDATATFGVKRNDTDAVVVADGTAMTRIATGTYEYTFTDPADDLTYTRGIEITYGGETYWIEEMFDGPTSGGILTVAELKDHLRVTHSGDDTLIQTIRDAVEDWIAEECAVGLTEIEHIDYVDGGGISLWPFTHPVISVSEVLDSENDTAESTSNYDLRSNSHVVHDGEARWADGRNRWKVTYNGGYRGAGSNAVALPARYSLLEMELVNRAYFNRSGLNTDRSGGVTLDFAKFVDSDISKLLQQCTWSSAIV